MELNFQENKGDEIIENFSSKKYFFKTINKKHKDFIVQVNAQACSQ